MQRILIPFIPAFYINQSEVVLSHRQDIGEIRVLGVDRVLEKLEVYEALNQKHNGDQGFGKGVFIFSPRAKEELWSDMIKFTMGAVS